MKRALLEEEDRYSNQEEQSGLFFLPPFRDDMGSNDYHAYSVDRKALLILTF